MSAHEAKGQDPLPSCRVMEPGNRSTEASPGTGAMIRFSTRKDSGCAIAEPEGNEAKKAATGIRFKAVFSKESPGSSRCT